MTTPALSSLPPHLWLVTAAVAVLLGLCGALVGLVTGRLVYLFGAARPSTPGRRAGAPEPCGSGQTEGGAVVDRTTGQAEGAAASARAVGPTDGAVAQGEVSAGAADGTADPAPGPVPDTVADPADDDEGPPPPRCPHCRAELRFARALPAVADRGFRRTGRCPHCERVVRPHPAVVAATAALFALTGALAVHHPSWFPFGHLAVLWLVATGVPLAVVDIRVMRLPDDLLAPAYPMAVLLVTAAVLVAPGGPDPGAAVDALAGMALVTVLFWLLWRVNPRGLGFGDVKISGLTGLYCGWAAGPLGALVAVFWAFTAFSLVVAALLVLRRVARRDPFPLGPFLVAATLATVLAGQPLVSGW
ncbi:A24 family peptidase [Nocardiopsis sp. NPDC049922]|uniref:prepilin peptidase n=1 Tax=Nocardiopsis sp. NPDC049922 TaxID=3155157 RepID=UPI00340B9B00